jgi:hypothetical protein
MSDGIFWNNNDENGAPNGCKSRYSSHECYLHCERNGYVVDRVYCRHPDSEHTYNIHTGKSCAPCRGENVRHRNNLTWGFFNGKDS